MAFFIAKLFDHLEQSAKQDTPLFYNYHGDKLTRQGITYILKKYTKPISLADTTPHILRHSKGMHMTEVHINPIYTGFSWTYRLKSDSDIF